MPSSHPGRVRTTRKSSSASHRSTLSLQKTEIKIHVYDLLPPGRLSSILWTLGSSLLHTGIVIKDKEYAYGGHEQPGSTGVYWTTPRLEPPGGTFRCEILHGFTFRTPDEIDAIIKDASGRFPGPAYNLLHNNCNHFTSYLCQALTSRPAPAWLNRAASIGVALPCVVPRDWLAPPDHDTAEGELLDEGADGTDAEPAAVREGRRRGSDSSEASDEGAGLLSGPAGTGVGVSGGSRGRRADATNSSATAARRAGSSRAGEREGSVRDSSGRAIPASERAPVPRRSMQSDG